MMLKVLLTYKRFSIVKKTKVPPWMWQEPRILVNQENRLY
jgi:hypothetical protein